METATSRWIAKAREIGQEVLARHADDVDQKARWPAESLAALAQSGLMGLTIPQAFGGAGEGARAFAAVTRVLAEHCASTAMIYLMHHCGAQMIVAAGGFSLRERVLGAVAAGRHLTTLAFSEKGSRSHFWAPVSQAVVNGDTHRLCAEKSWVTSAGHADSYVVSTRSAGRSEPTAMTIYYAPKDAPGLAVSGRWNGLGLRGNASAPMRLENVALPAAHRLSPEGEGFDMAMKTIMPWCQVGSTAVSVGIAQAATTSTRKHLLASKLEHLGQSLASLPNLRARLAQMQIAVDIQQVFLENVAERMDTGADIALALLECKAASAEAAWEVTDLGMRTCGGAAFSKHLTVERNSRDARASSVMAPTTDILYDFIGRTLLDMPLLS